MSLIGTNDTIVAISTPVGEAGIGIVRISGQEALEIADRIFLAKENKLPSSFKAYTTHYGWIIKTTKKDRSSGDGIVDEVLLTVMRAPRSYTKEDIVEINCHGGIIALRAVLDLTLDSGARLAEPGEFTRRAFLSGRIDLAQAEAVLDIIRAKTDSALKIGAEQLKGALSREIRRVRKLLLETLSILEANINFPEEEIGRIDSGSISQQLSIAGQQISVLLDGAKKGMLLREGIHVVICGKPNAGKSSLLNALLRQERSIVTPICGTTRDTIEEIIDINGIPVRIVDTAGIIEPQDLIEKKAIERTTKQIKLADLVILLFDGSRKLDNGDRLLIRRLKKKKVIAVINKIDLTQRIEEEKILKAYPAVVKICAKKSRNLKLLEDAISLFVYGGKVGGISSSVIVTSARHVQALKGAQKNIAEALDSLDNKLSPEFIAQDLKEAVGHLDDLSGGNSSEDLLNRIFSEFCIGK
ncbi:MAG: tRNA uridine-5-carboxymethylaminomethyl(34) synthesis GTPase MnmE [Candidatus Omnitrophica bacterium]|nr:tRNA uridine-5-carboxymethylaminomethyl(34) synthesis GTPase MnmE [Candidatus Omnitrophota bacterium]